jgi:hypothetical protein
MATPNFSYHNANNVYAVHGFDDFTPKLLQDEVREALKDNKELFVKDIEEYDGDRTYPAMMYSEINREFEFCGVSVCVSVELGIRAGYYGGNNLDFNIKVECGNAWSWIDPYYYWHNSNSPYEYSDPCELAGDFWDDVIECSVSDLVGISKGVMVMNKGRFARRLAYEINGMMELANGLCKKLCEAEYACVGIFSNGEAIYEAV